MRNFILKNGQSMVIDIVKSDNAEEIIRYTKTIGSESDNVTFGPEGIPVTLEQEKTFLASFSEKSLFPMFAAKIDGEIVSLANLAGNDRPRLRHNAEIGISVLKKYWNIGVGTKMIQVLIEHAKSTNVIENLFLKVRSDNLNAIRLYESHGFSTVGTYPRQMKIDHQYFDTLLMYCPLS